MFGENEVNDYHLVKYSLLFDFFVYFSPVKMFGLPVAQCLVGMFLTYIKPFVDENRENQKLINDFRTRNNFQTMGDINQKLIAFDNVPVVTRQKNKKSILLSESYYDFAFDQLKEFEFKFYEVEFKNYLRDEFKSMRDEAIRHQQQLLKAVIDYRFKTLPSHYYFSNKLFQQWFIKACMGITNWVYCLEQLIIKKRPSVIIVPSEAGLYGTILGLLSKKYQIPFINMPILTIGDRILIPSRADYYFVWGRNQKNWFINRKIREDKIVETGNVKFFYQKKNVVSSKEYFYKKFNIPSNHYILGFTTQPYLNTNDKVEKWIEALPNNLQVTIIIKKHKADQYAYSLLRKKKNVKILSSDYPLDDFLHHINCLMTIASTTAFEAAILDKPLLILQPIIPYHYALSYNQNNAFFAKAQAGEIIKNKEDLIDVVTRVTTEPSYIDDLKKKGNKFLSETLVSVNEAPVLAKTKIKEIISHHS